MAVEFIPVDRDTPYTFFRKCFLKELVALFVEILVVAEAMGLVKLGTISLVDTTVIGVTLSCV